MTESDSCDREPYYVWRSDSRQISTVHAKSARAAADQYALQNRIPFNIALRVVAVEDVTSFGVRLKEDGGV